MASSKSTISTTGWNFPDWTDTTIGVKIVAGEVIITDPELARVLDAATPIDGIPNLDFSNAANNAENV